MTNDYFQQDSLIQFQKYACETADVISNQSDDIIYLDSQSQLRNRTFIHVLMHIL